MGPHARSNRNEARAPSRPHHRQLLDAFSAYHDAVPRDHAAGPQRRFETRDWAAVTPTRRGGSRCTGSVSTGAMRDAVDRSWRSRKRPRRGPWLKDAFGAAAARIAPTPRSRRRFSIPSLAGFRAPWVPTRARPSSATARRPGSRTSARLYATLDAPILDDATFGRILELFEWNVPYADFARRRDARVAGRRSGFPLAVRRHCRLH